MKTESNHPTNSTRTVTIAFVAFVGLGLMAGLLGLAWPSMQQEFSLPLDAVNILYVMQTVSYTLASFYIGRLMSRFGSGTVLLTGAVLISLSLFVTAAAGAWLIVVLIAFVGGLGSGMIDAGLNLYVATHHTARQMSWLHASFGIGVTVGPLIMTFALQQKLGWHVGYAVVGALLLILVLLFGWTRREWLQNRPPSTENRDTHRANFASTLRVPTVWFGMLTFLAYVGVEIGIGQWAYTLLTQSRGVDPGLAGVLVSVYWGVFTGGRIFFGIIANRFPVERILRVCMIGMIIGCVLLWWNPINLVGLLGLVLLGFAEAPVFPMLMSATSNRVGPEHAENGISLQMAGVGIGTAILPGLIGTLGKNYGLETMPLAFLIGSIIVFGLHELSLVSRVSPAVVSATGD